MTIHITKEIEAAYVVYVEEVIDAGFTGQPIRRRDTYPFMHGNTFVGLVDFAAGYNSAHARVAGLEVTRQNLEKYIAKLGKENLKMSEKLANSYVTPPDKGPWEVGNNFGGTTTKEVFIQSHEFSTDARLYVDGDFYDIEHKKNYAAALAHMMNKAADNETTQRRAVELLDAFDKDVGVHHSGNLSSVEHPSGEVAGPCICGSWPGGKCLKCPKIS